jgi:hypothetical protein
MTKLKIAMLSAGLLLSLSPAHAQSGDPGTWDAEAAAAYLDQRVAWWSGWETAARERGTFCVSCHTTGPYGLARPMLRPAGDASAASRSERALLDSVATRVIGWTEVGPFYPDERYGVPKTSESRGTEAILNALVLARQDARAGTLSDLALRAFDNLWALQETSGDAEGAWPWLHFNLAPWESDEGPYHGAALAAVAVGLAPAGYGARPDIQANVTHLADYLRRRLDAQPPFNRAMALWASGALTGLLEAAERQAIVDEIVALQRDDGGWSLSSLGTWTRRDETPLDTQSDGYATGLVTLALQQAGLSREHKAVASGLAWLTRNQDPDGSWPASSLNRERDPASDRGRFMRDAATAYAVLALTAGNEPE